MTASAATADLYDREVRDDPLLREYERSIALIRESPDQGFDELTELANRGSILAALFIADHLRLGRHYQQDLPMAEKWYRVAAKRGSVRATYGLALTHHKMGRHQIAVGELEDAISRSYPPAMNWLACMYYIGNGIDEDKQKSLELWRRGASLEHVYSTKNLAHALLGGKFGISQMFVGFYYQFLAIVRLIKIFTQDQEYGDRMR